MSFGTLSNIHSKFVKMLYWKIVFFQPHKIGAKCRIKVWESDNLK